MSASDNNGQRRNGDVCPPPVIPDHKLFRCIGRGSYGEVWLAQNMMGALRAIKVVYRRDFSDTRPFERELAGIKKFEPISRTHEGFVDILQIGSNEAAGYFYYVMELADDEERGQNIDPNTYCPKTLGRNSVKESRLPIEKCLHLGLNLSNALIALHKAGLVHRDIKPSNIIFVNGMPKLADIGLVASIDETHSFVGTEGFVPREGPGTPSADIFGLGKVLYEISTGQDRQEFPRLPQGCEQLVSDASFLELNEVILRACQNDAHKRYTSAEEMHADLTFLLNGKSVKRLRVLERRWAQTKKASIPVAILILLAGTAYYQMEREKRHQNEIRGRDIGYQTAVGIQAMEEGRLADALPPFIEALRLDRPERSAMHRMQIGMILDQCPKLVHMWADSGPLTDCQFSSDGRFLAITRREHQAQVIDLDRGEAASPNFGQTFSLESACFSPDQKYVLTTSMDKTVGLWDWRTGDNRLLKRLPQTVITAQFNHKGDLFIAGGGDTLVSIWRTSTGELLLPPLHHHREFVHFAGFSPDDRYFVTASHDQSAAIWDAQTCQVLHSNLLHKSWVVYAAFSPDGSKVATASADNSAIVWDVATGQQVLPPLEHPDGVSSVDFSPDGRWILTGCWDSTARLWDAATGQPTKLNSIFRHSGRVMRATFHPDGHRFATVCYDGTCRLWDLSSSGTLSQPFHATFSSDGLKFLVRSNGIVRVGETKTGKVHAPLGSQANIEECAFGPDSRFVLMLSSDDDGGGDLTIWETDTDKQLSIVPSFSTPLKNVALGQEGRWLAVWNGNKADILDLNTKQRVVSLVQTGSMPITRAMFNPGSDKLLTCGWREACLWNLATTNGLILKHPVPIRTIRFSPNGKLLVIGCQDEVFTECAAYLWDTATGTLVGQPLAHRDGVLSAAFDARGTRLITGAEDFTASIWDMLREGPPKKLQHKHQVRDACFNGGGAIALTVSRDRTARLWDTQSGEPLCPPLPHFHDLSNETIHHLLNPPRPNPCDLFHGAFVDEDSVLTSNMYGDSWLWKITTDERSSEELAAIADVLTGKRPSSSNSSTQAQETVYTRWQKMQDKFPKGFINNTEKLIAWHRQQAAASLGEGRLAGALFHFDRLLELQPAEPAISRLRSELIEEIKAQCRREPEAGASAKK